MDTDIKTNLSASAETDGRTDYTPLADIRDILNALWWMLYGIGTFNYTEFVCRLLGHGFDPEGSRLPEWNIDPNAPPFVVLPNECVHPDGEGVAIYDKVLYTNAKEVSKDPWSAEVLTQAEIISLFNYNPKLTNTSFAKQVKHYLRLGKTDHEIAVLSKYAEKTVKHFRLALEKAYKSNN